MEIKEFVKKKQELRSKIKRSIHEALNDFHEATGVFACGDACFRYIHVENSYGELVSSSVDVDVTLETSLEVD